MQDGVFFVLGRRSSSQEIKFSRSQARYGGGKKSKKQKTTKTIPILNPTLALSSGISAGTPGLAQRTSLYGQNLTLPATSYYEKLFHDPSLPPSADPSLSHFVHVCFSAVLVRGRRTGLKAPFLLSTINLSYFSMVGPQPLNHPASLLPPPQKKKLVLKFVGPNT